MQHVWNNSLKILRRKQYTIKYVPTHDYVIYTNIYDDIINKINNNNYEKLRLVEKINENKNKFQPFVHP